MGKNFKFYITLFFTTLKVSAFTYGGGYVIVSLMKKEYVDKLGWLTEREMLDFTALAQSSPGSIALNASNIIGYKLAGIKGAIITVVAATLPPLIIITIVSIFYDKLRNNSIIANVMIGMQAGVGAILLDVVISLVLNVVKSKKLILIGIMIVSFILVYFLNLNVIFIILGSGVIGIINNWFNKKEVIV